MNNAVGGLAGVAAAGPVPRKLNVGCGTDYREGFINIDGSNVLSKVDAVIDIGKASLLDHFGAGEVDFILANDIIEHHFRWEALAILRDFFTLLAPGGSIEIRVPDAKFIIGSWRMPIEKKIVLLYGGQDIPQGNAEMDESRKKFPGYFCHKYGWTMQSMKKELEGIGFKNVNAQRQGTNFVSRATK
ncbi:MAG TPA: methyltransferase domain-containing protein [Burkholderiales bacterium]|nr:methyltransferase domain-containing protein [Burkholderiales bacterium]